MLKVFSDIFNTLGPAVVVPIMIFVVSVALGVQVKKSIMSGLYAGIGLTGFGWVIGSFAPAVTQLVDQMVKATGLKLEVVDMGKWVLKCHFQQLSDFHFLYLDY